MAVGRGCHPTPSCTRVTRGSTCSFSQQLRCGQGGRQAAHTASLAAPSLGEHVGRCVLAGRVAWCARWCMRVPRMSVALLPPWGVGPASTPNLASLWVSTFMSVKWARGSEDSPRAQGL